MKLLTKLKVSYLILGIVVLVVMCGSCAGILVFGFSSLEKQYDVSDKTGVEAVYNPLSLIGNLTTTAVDEIEKTIKNNPDELLNQTYLTNFNNRLKDQASYMIVRQGTDIVFKGSDSDESVQNISWDVDNEGRIFLLDGNLYHMIQRNVTFTDGSSGSVSIVTDMNSVLTHTKRVIMQLIGVLVLVFVASAIIVIYWVYRSVIKPVNKLKQAAENIKEGNLNFSVEAQTDDELGELCVAFEEMRSKLKEQVDLSMQYEKDNKELISNISHDLKTPVTAIKGYIEGILDGVADTPEKQERYIRTIYSKTNDMQKMIEELFLYSKLDNNAIAYSFQKVNLNDYFEDCIEEISVDLESKHIGLGFFNYVDKNCVIIADPEQLKRVIINIVSNSAKYIDNPHGLINIRLHDEPEFVQIEIEDNGKGIAPDELPHIFERLYRTDSSRNSAQGGSGLGLSIARKIVEEHGGRIWATSKVGIGTNICFVLRKYEENRVYE